ncbi:hypothetical protein M758_10G112400 [Ceratodon purpureus]|nr:hypothetical protein M758_10G112400 [Ceratodon purpureus]
MQCSRILPFCGDGSARDGVLESKLFDDGRKLESGRRGGTADGTAKWWIEKCGQDLIIRSASDGVETGVWSLGIFMHVDHLHALAMHAIARRIWNILFFFFFFAGIVRGPVGPVPLSTFF